MFYLILILLLFLLLSITAILTTVACFFIYGAPYVRTSDKNAMAMFGLAKIIPGEKFYDLGCGDGSLLFIAEKDFKAKVFGFEISPWPYFFAQIKKLFKRSKAKIYFKNYMKADLSKADVIFCFLMPKPMEKLKTKFEKELKKGCRIVSNAFAIPGLRPQKVIYSKKTPIFLYQR